MARFVTLAIVNWFRPEIRGVLARLKQMGKFMGNEIELLDELQAKTEAAEAKLPEITGTGSLNVGNATVEGRGTVEPSDAEDDIEEVLREAARSPKLGLMLLSAKMERAARRVGRERLDLDVAGRSCTPQLR